MKFTFTGNPLSVNAMYRGRRFLTDTGKSAKQTMAYEAKKQWKRKEILTGDLDVHINFYFKDRKRHDIDNCIKATLDSLTDVVWADDSQIQRLSAEKFVDKLNPRVELIIK